MGNEQTVGQGKSRFQPPNIEAKYQTGSDNYQLALLFKYVISKVNFAVPPGKPITVIAPACGKLPESDVLQSFFGGENPGVGKQKVRVIGIDLNEQAIQGARKIAGEVDDTETENPQSNFEFKAGDARDLSGFPPADVVFIEHQEIGADERTWKDIFAAGIRQLADEDAIMIVTSYTQEEHDIAMRVLGKLDCEIMLNEYNPSCIPMKTTKMPIDGKHAIAMHRNVAVIKKKPTQH